MSFIRDVVDSFTGGRQAASAARRAAGVQSGAAGQAITAQEEGRDVARADLEPFSQAGREALSGLSGLITDPSQQLSFIQDNPFFQSLVDESTNRLFANKAATGKVGSGGTAEALQNSLLLLGTDLLNQNIGQRQNLAGLGLNAATGQANVTQGATANISNLITGRGNVEAAGIVGASNAINQGRGDLINAGAGIGTALIMACDSRIKENIKRIGTADNGLPLYLFNYKGDNKFKPHINVMAQDVEKVKPKAVFEINNIKYIKVRELWH